MLSSSLCLNIKIWVYLKFLDFFLGSWYRIPVCIRFFIKTIFTSVLYICISLYFSDPIYCMDPIVDARLRLEYLIAKTQSEVDYWKAQMGACKYDFRQCIRSNDSEGQQNMLRILKETQHNVNDKQNFLNKLNDKLASGNYVFKEAEGLGKRSR